MAPLPRVLVRPDHLPSTQPDADAIYLLARPGAPLGAWLRYGLLRLLVVLREFNTLLLPPLYTLLAVEWGLGPSALPARSLFVTLGGFFLVEWILGLVLARHKGHYLANLWLLADLLSSLPLAAAFQSLRLTRLARLARFTRLLHLLRARRFRFPVTRIVRVGGVSLSIASAGAIALVALEPTTVTGLGDALWWAMVTMTTVGYGDISPATPAGRLVAVLLMVTSVGVFGYLAGLMANALFDAEDDDLTQHVARVEAKLDRVLEQLADRR